MRWLWLLLLLASPAAAQSPEFGALDGAVTTRAVIRDFDGYRMPIGPFTRQIRPVARLEGRLSEYVYRIDSDLSTLFAIRNYERALKEAGYTIRYQCAARECGSFDFRFGTYVSAPPAMRVNIGDYRDLAASDDAGGRHASVLASRQGGALFVQVMAVETEPAADAISAENAPVPVAKPGRALLFAMARRLTENGFAVVEGIDFNPGSATLTSGSGASLAQAAELLRARPDLRYRVVGHTDNDGDLELNTALSLARAEAVADALAAEPGIDRARLIPHGLAFLAPRATNATEDGRAQNRRVELVVE